MKKSTNELFQSLSFETDKEFKSLLPNFLKGVGGFKDLSTLLQESAIEGLYRQVSQEVASAPDKSAKSAKRQEIMKRFDQGLYKPESKKGSGGGSSVNFISRDTIEARLSLLGASESQMETIKGLSKAKFTALIAKKAKETDSLLTKAIKALSEEKDREIALSISEIDI